MMADAAFPCEEKNKFIRQKMGGERQKKGCIYKHIQQEWRIQKKKTKKKLKECDNANKQSN